MEKLRYADRSMLVELVGRGPGLRLAIDGHAIDIREDATAASGPISLEIGGRRIKGWRHCEGADIFLRLDGRSFHLKRETAGFSEGEATGDGSEVRASMPGVVVSVGCRPGQAVAKGATLIVIESMKMQMTIAAPRDGVVENVHFAENAVFDKGAALVSLQPQQA